MRRRLMVVPSRSENGCKAWIDLLVIQSGKYWLPCRKMLPMAPRSISQLVTPHAYLLGGTHKFIDLLIYALSSKAEEYTISLYHKEIKSLLGVKTVFSYASGRAALMEILAAIGVNNGDEIIIPGYTCIVIPAAVIAVGARPVYADIDLNTLNVRPEAVERLISSRTRAILAQHTFGIPCDVRSLEAIAARHGIHLIEDCAHALGAKIGNRYCGNFGSAAFFSTEQTKMISTVKGGLAVTNDPSIAEKLERSYLKLPSDEPARVKASIARWRKCNLETHPRLGALFSFATRMLERFPLIGPALKRADSFDNDEYSAALNGTVRQPTKLSREQAAIGLIQIPRIERDVEQRNQIARELVEKTTSLGWRIPTVDWNNTRPSFVRFPAIVQDRQYWLELLRRNGIDEGQWLDHPLHPAGSNFRACGYEIGMCPNAESISSQTINLPIHPRCASWISARITNLMR
jgi:perosamine synthetase